MTNHLPEDDDARLRVLFSAALEPVADAGFSERVQRRIARNAVRRQLVLGGAALVGVAVAAAPLWSLARALGDAVITNTDRFAVLGDWTMNPLVLAAGVLLLAAPRVLRWLEE